MSANDFVGSGARSIDVAAEMGVRGGFLRIALALSIVFAWCVGWYWSTATEIATLWWLSETFAHGLIVLPAFGWLVWRLRHRIELLSPQPQPIGIFVVLFGGFLWLTGTLAAVSAASHAGLGLMIIGSFVTVLGRQLSVALSFPLAFLLFGVPIGEFLLPEMMDLTAKFTVFALRLSGIPVYQEGLQFVIPNGRWSVVEACSGIRYLIASLFVGSLYAYLNFTSTRKRILFMCAALIVPILANWFRAYLIVMLGYLSGNELATGVDHLIYGWLFFGVVILLLFACGRRWIDEPEDLREAIPAGPAQKLSWGTVVALFLVLASFPLALARLTEPAVPGVMTLTPPAAASGWNLDMGATPAYRPTYLGYRAMAQAVYASSEPDQPPVYFFSALFSAQSQGAEMVTFGNGLRPEEGQGARVVPTEVLDTNLGVVNYALINTTGRFAVAQWYVVDGDVVSRDWEVKARLALLRLLGQGDESMVFVVATPVGDEPGTERLRAFIAAHASSLSAGAEQAMGRRER